MSSVARASTFIRHLPVVYRHLTTTGRLSNLGSVSRIHGATNLPNFHYLTCSFSRNIHTDGTTYQMSDLQNRIGQGRNRNPETEFRVVLRRLDDMVRRTGRITRNQLELVFDEVCKLGVATPNQSLLLIRSCGSLLPEVQPKERTELVHKFWDKMKEFGTTYDASHYNALLKVYLQNEHEFSPTEFLSKMEQGNVEPNRVTYQRLISAYCLNGDIAGATQILEFMKTKDLPVTEGVFNSLITGHARAKDMENAKNILNVMRTVGLEPSADTFTTLMAAYAENGEFAEIEKTIEEAESQNVTLSTRHILSVAYALAVSGNSELLPKILEKTELGSGFIPDTINLCLSLMARDLDEAAFETVKLFVNVKDDRSEKLVEGETFNQGNFFIDHAIIKNMPFEKLSKYMDQMIELGLHSAPHTVALQAALRRRETGYAEKVIGRMKELGLPLRSHYFWPLLVKRSPKEKQKVKSLLGLMYEVGVPLNIDTFSLFILPVLNCTSEEMLQTVQELNGVVDRDLVNALCRQEVKKGRLSGVAKLLEQYEDMVDVSTFKASLVGCFGRSPDVEPFVKILKHASNKFEGNSYGENGVSLEEYIGTILYDTVASIQADNLISMKPHLQLLFSRMAEEELYINGLRFRGIRNIFDRHRILGLKQVALKIVDPKEREEKKVENLDLFSQEDVDVADLEKLCTEMKEKDGNYRGPLRALLLHHCSANNYDKAMEVKKQFEETGYDFTGAMYASMISMCCNLEKTSEAMLLKKQLKEFDPNFQLDVTKYRMLVNRLSKEGKVTEAIQLLEEMAEHDSDSDRLEKNMFHMLNDLAKEGLTSEVQLLFDNLVSKNVVKVTNNLIGPLVTAYIVKDDMTGALQCISDCQTKYKLMPHFHDILVRLVEKGNTEQLQKAMDFASEHHGDLNMLYDLIFAFLTTGKLKEAQKVIETPGMVSRDRRLQWFAEKCISSNKLEPLEQLVAITRDLYGCDRDNMHFYLIQYYARAKNPEKCLQVWTNMQEEGIIPKDRTLRYLANVLNTHNIPVPFEVPELPVLAEVNVEQPERLPSEVERIQRQQHDHPIISLAKAGNMIEAERQLESAQEAGEEVPLGVYRIMMWEELKRGNIEECLAYRDQCMKFSDFVNTREFNNRLQIEYVKKGNMESAYRVYSETLASGMVPLMSGIRQMAAHCQETGDISKILEMKELYETSTKMSFPASKSILATFLAKNDVEGALSFIKKELEKSPERSRQMGLRSFSSKLIQNNIMSKEVTDLAEQQLSQDVDGPMWGLVYAYLDNNCVDEAKALMEKHPALKERSSALLSYIIEMVGKDHQAMERIENVMTLTEGQTYLDREKVYFYLLKACDLQDDWQGGLKVKERMESEGIQITDFNLKRLGLLLERNQQEVPFDMPPESLAFYREQLVADQKDKLPEIVTE